MKLLQANISNSVDGSLAFWSEWQTQDGGKIEKIEINFKKKVTLVCNYRKTQKDICWVALKMSTWPYNGQPHCMSPSISHQWQDQAKLMSPIVQVWQYFEKSTNKIERSPNGGGSGVQYITLCTASLSNQFGQHFKIPQILSAPKTRLN